jgi:glycosidase
MFFTSNHDENSHSGSEYERMGNAAKAFAVLCATWNGIPLIYSGQELPNSQRLKFFEKDPIRWTGNFGLHNFYKKLLELHRDHPALRVADENIRTYRISTSEDEKIFSYLRIIGEREILVILNLSAIDDLHFEIMGENVLGIFRNVFTGEAISFTDSMDLTMKAWDYLVFEK